MTRLSDVGEGAEHDCPGNEKNPNRALERELVTDNAPTDSADAVECGTGCCNCGEELIILDVLFAEGLEKTLHVVRTPGRNNGSYQKLDTYLIG